MFNGDDGLCNMVDVVSGSDTGDEIPVQTIGRSEATLEGGTNRSGLHGVGNVNVRNLHSTGAGCFDGNWNLNHAVAVFGNVVVERIDQGWSLLHDGTNRGVIRSDN